MTFASRQRVRPASRPKIAISAGSYDVGGIGTALLTLTEGLIAAGHPVDLLVVTRPHMSRPVPPEAGCYRLAPTARKGLWAMVRYFRQAQPEVVIVARDYIGLVTDMALRLAGRRKVTRVIWTFHTMMSDDAKNASLYKRAILWLARNPIRRAEACIGVSDGVSRAAEATFGLPSGSVLSFPNAVWSNDRKAKAVAAVPPPSGRKRILCCARLVPQKDLGVLLEAFAPLTRRLDCELLIAGEGPLRQALTAQIAQLGLTQRVTLLGQQPDCLGWMQTADCLVLSSRYEGAPVVLVEGLVVGLPIVSTDCPSGPAEILQNGTLGALVPVGDCAAMTQALYESLTSPVRDVDLAARQSAALRYRADVVAQRYSALCDRICQ